MADILFKCSACSRHLVVNVTVMGTVIACTECSQQIFVPQSGIWFKCSKCLAELAAPSGLVGEPFHCPNCGEDVVVPQHSTAAPSPSGKPATVADLLFTCSACARHLAVDAASVGAVVACKACKQQVIVPKAGLSFKCQRCQRDLVAPLSLAGQVFDCPQCEASLVVPQQSAAAPATNGKPAPKVDVLFKCSACSGQLSADVTSVGTIVACAACKQAMIVPKPNISFKCQKCLRELGATPNMGGEATECPRCGGALVVPAAAIRLPQKQTGKS